MKQKNFSKWVFAGAALLLGLTACNNKKEDELSKEKGYDTYSTSVLVRMIITTSREILIRGLIVLSPSPFTWLMTPLLHRNLSFSISRKLACTLMAQLVR